MADGAKDDIAIQRNEDWFREIRFKGEGDARLDISGWSFSLRADVSAGLGGVPLFLITETPTDNGSVIRKISPSTDGAISVLIRFEDLAVFGGRSQDIERYPFNLVCTDENDVVRADLRGLLIVEPGVGTTPDFLLATEGGLSFVTADTGGNFLEI